MTAKLCPQCRRLICTAHRWLRKTTPTAFKLHAGSFSGIVGWATHWVAEIEWDTAVPHPERTTMGPGPRKEPWEEEPWHAEVELWPSKKRSLGTHDRRFKTEEDMREEALLWFERHGGDGDILLMDPTGGSCDAQEILACKGPDSVAILVEGNSLYEAKEALYDGVRGPSSIEKYDEIFDLWQEFIKRWK